MYPIKKRAIELEGLKMLKDAALVDNFPDFRVAYKDRITILESTARVRDSKLLTFEDDPVIHFLGTGSMMPATYRNVSSISLLVNKRYNLLLDCGEGTYSQLVDTYGPKGIEEYLRHLRVIYITHIHPDHNIGVFKMLSERQQLEQSLGETFEVDLASGSPCSSSCRETPFQY